MDLLAVPILSDNYTEFSWTLMLPWALGNDKLHLIYY